MRSKPVARKRKQSGSGDELEMSKRSASSMPDEFHISSPNHKRGRSAEQMLSELAYLSPPPELDVQNGSIYAKVTLHRGFQFGPYPIKWTAEPTDKNVAWEVISAPGVSGWLEPVPQFIHWLKEMKTIFMEHEANVKCCFVHTGCLWYEVIRDIPAGDELLLTSKVPLNLKDMFYDNSDKETGSQHSGAIEEDFGTANDLQSNKCDLNISIDADPESEDETRIEFQCPDCERLCADLEQLDNHLVLCHNYKKDDFRCEICSQGFCFRPSLLRHRSLQHGEIRRFPCENCSKVFTDASNLQRHIRNRHKGARAYPCGECGKTFATESGRKQHTHIHSSVKPFQCEVCFKAYTQFSNLCRHKRMHADCRMQIKCQKCTQSFSTVTSLSKHKRFCDTTSVPQSTAPQQHSNSLSTPPTSSTHSSQSFLGSTVPQLPMASRPNPFLMLPGSAQFFPGFPPYPDWQRIFPNNAAQAPFPLLFPHPLDRPMPESKTPVRSLSSTQDGSIKVSPPTAEEASNHLRPSPSRPIPISIGMQHSLKNHNNNNNSSKKNSNEDSYVVNGNSPSSKGRSTRSKSFLSIENLTMKNESKRTLGNSDSEYNSPPKQRKLSDEDEKDISTTAEQPLDLSLNKSSKRSESGSPIVDEPKGKLFHASPTPSPSPEPLSPSPPNPPMAYPRPIHPVLLEAFYNQQRGFQRPFPFLGHLTRPVDILNNGTAFNKPFHDVLMAAGGFATGLSNSHHNGAKNKDRYACKFCAKVFPRSANLTRHLRTHTGEQPYQCKYCERSFSISSNLQRHVRNIHNKEKPYRCHLCERCFGQQTNLDRHLKKHESDVNGLGMGAGDSPSSNELEPEENCFDEFRQFFGKVTYSEGLYTPSSVATAEGGEMEDGSDIDADIVVDKEPINNNEAVEVSI
ncbi:histone-lysine N-methyltransferase PRDM16-like isoform X2 [Contarinia nasturtii]|uniref:histone-lysine N-methyltransferase PRDM16-like isoform X2 n=1 Tax=Contarinia nasturtii TaxID=265458 RepID=UPI0012D3C322|nr:histone-lysine N-methyltransferase PRDM16-like isoform X2 [Contarinia nasturtii]